MTPTLPTTPVGENASRGAHQPAAAVPRRAAPRRSTSRRRGRWLGGTAPGPRPDRGGCPRRRRVAAGHTGPGGHGRRGDAGAAGVHRVRPRRAPGTPSRPPTSRTSTPACSPRRTSVGSSAYARTTRARPLRGRWRRAGTARSPSRCSATGSRGSRRPCATTSSRRSATGGSRRPAPTSTRPGVVLVGGGPGDPALVTVAARQALAAADVVVADRLAPRALLDELSADVELVDVAKLPRGRAAAAGADQPGARRPGPGRQAGGAVQGRRLLRLRPRLRGGAGVPRGGRTRERGARAAQPGRGHRRGRHPADPPRGRP